MSGITPGIGSMRGARQKVPACQQLRLQIGLVGVGARIDNGNRNAGQTFRQAPGISRLNLGQMPLRSKIRIVRSRGCVRDEIALHEGKKTGA